MDGILKLRMRFASVYFATEKNFPFRPRRRTSVWKMR